MSNNNIKMSNQMSNQMSSQVSDMEALAISIAGLYKDQKICAAKTGSKPTWMSDKYTIHDDVNQISGKKNLQLMLITGHNYYNNPTSVIEKKDEDELKKMKAILPEMSLQVDKLNKLSTKNPDNTEMYNEYKVKKAAYDHFLENYGSLLKKTTETGTINTSNVAEIKKAYKILMGFCGTSSEKKKAQNLYNLIKQKVLPSTTVKHYVSDEDDEYHDDVSVEQDDGWTAVPTKKNPFDSFNKKKQVNTYEHTAPAVETNVITAKKLDELIKKYEAKQYLTPNNRKIVEEELAKRANAFPALGGVETSVSKPKFTGVSFKEMFTEKKTNSSTTTTSTTAATNKSGGIRIVEMDPSPEPFIVETIVNGTLTTYVYKKTNEDGKEVKYRTTVPNKHFHEMMMKQNEEQKEYRQFLWEREHRPWCKGMTFDEWCDFKDEVAYHEELDRQREEEKYGGFCYDDGNEYGEDDEYNGEYDENAEYDNHDETVVRKEERVYSVHYN